MKYLPLLLLAASSASPALAGAFTDLVMLDREVAAFAGAPLGAPGGPALPVDRRLRLSQCADSLALSWYGSRRETVLVECPAASGWKVYVPLRIAASAASSAPMVARGEMVTILINSDGFAISQQGEALEAGTLGAWIKVRKVGGKAEALRAQVLRPGVVGILLP